MFTIQLPYMAKLGCPYNCHLVNGLLKIENNMIYYYMLDGKWRDWNRVS